MPARFDDADRDDADDARADDFRCRGCEAPTHNGRLCIYCQHAADTETINLGSDAQTLQERTS